MGVCLGAGLGKGAREDPRTGRTNSGGDDVNGDDATSGTENTGDSAAVVVFVVVFVVVPGCQVMRESCLLCLGLAWLAWLSIG